MNNKELLKKQCVPCESGTAPLSKEEVTSYLSNVEGWETNTEATRINKRFEFSNFKEALAFVNAVGEKAEHEGHHPDILLHEYKYVTLTLSTHAIKGLSENDFILAAKIDTI